MEKAYRAVSSAIYGKDKGKLVMSMSVVAAHGEDDIRLEHTRKDPIDTASAASVRERFEAWFATLQDTIRQQKAVHGGLSVPVVFGVPSNFPGLDLTDTLRAVYADVLRHHPVPPAKEKKRQLPDIPPHMLGALRFLAGESGMRGGRPIVKGIVARKSGEQDQEEADVFDLDKALVEHLLRRTAAARPGKAAKMQERYKNDITFHPRLFQPIHHGVGADLQSDDPIRRLNVANAVIRPERGQEFERLHGLAAAGDAAALERLRGMAKEEAASMAASYADRFQGHAGPLSRFIMLAPPVPPFTTRPELNYLQWFDLRKVFGTEFARVLGLEYPICVKAPGDPASPAFADVAATYAYQLKKTAETGKRAVNGTVMITSRMDQPAAANPETGGAQ